MTEERKLVTVLFADIVGSTELTAATNPEVVRRALTQVFAASRDILVAHGGTVEKFIGDAVMAVFGVPTAHDDDADRAVRAAFALRDALEEWRRSGSLPLTLRTGLNTGEVVAGTGEGDQFLVTGEPVNVAARIQQAAAPGEILAGDLTRRLTERTVRYEAARDIDAKGLGRIRVHPAAALTTAVPEQVRGIAGLRAPLIGRDHEMRVLVDSYRRMGGERRAYLVTIFGPPGAGKSRLTREFVDTIGPERVRRGRCLPYGGGITYWPVQEILRRDAGIRDEDAAEEAGRRLRSAVLAAFGPSEDAEAVARRLAVLAGTAEASDALPDVDAREVADELRWGLRRYLERRAADSPFTIVVDDIQWAEPALLDLLDHLVEWSRAPLFVVCLARPELLDVRPGWGGGKTNAAAIALQPLTPEETHRLIGTLLAIDDLPADLRAEVVARAEGNPLYVEEFLRMLIDEGRIERRDGRWVATPAIGALVVPPTVHGLIAARLDRLPPAVKRALQVASVVGKVFWTTALETLAELPARPAELLAEAARRDLVVEIDDRGPRGGRGFTFTHLLVRDVAYETIPMEARAALHDRFGRWLEEAAGERREEYAEIVAYHAEEAYRYARELALPDAGPHGQRAVALLLPAMRRARDRGDIHATASLAERAAAIADAIAAPLAERIEATGHAAGFGWAMAPTAKSRARLDGALDQARGAGPSETLVRLASERGHLMLTEDTDRAARLLDEALAAARATGDPALIAYALVQRGWVPFYEGDLERHTALLRSALEEIHALGVRDDTYLRCLGWLWTSLRQQGRFVEAAGHHAELAAAASPGGSKVNEWVRLQGLSWEAEDLGDHARAVDLAEQSMSLAREIGVRTFVLRAHERLGEALHGAGELERSRAVLEEGLALADPTLRGIVPELAWRLSRTCLTLGEVAEARRHAEATLAVAAPSDTTARSGGLGSLAAVRVAEGQARDGERLLGEAVATARGYRIQAAQQTEAVARAHLRWGSPARARELLLGIRPLYDQPPADRKLAEIDALIARSAAVPTR